jgi:hypothetical protein
VPPAIAYVANYVSTSIKKIIGIGREISGRGKNGAIFNGGIARDFQQFRPGDVRQLELLEPQLANDDTRALLKEARDAATLASKLTDQLLSFARRRHVNMQALQLNDLVVGITGMLRRTHGRANSPVDIVGARGLADSSGSRPASERQYQPGGESPQCDAARRHTGQSPMWSTAAGSPRCVDPRGHFGCSRR